MEFTPYGGSDNGQQLDLRQLILDDLAALGHPYTAVVTVPEFQINIAQLGVGFTDQDVILARTDLVNSGAIKATQQGHYSHLVPLPAFPPYLPTTTSITRGWACADVLLNGTAFRFITTHLEDGTNALAPLSDCPAPDLQKFKRRTGHSRLHALHVADQFNCWRGQTLLGTSQQKQQKARAERLKLHPSHVL